jgi:hypothetical protein
MECSSVSPGSRYPPGRDHEPEKGSFARCQSSAWSFPARTWKTTASVACVGEVFGIVVAEVFDS